MASLEPLIERYELLLMVAAFAVLYILVAFGLHYLRTHVYMERDTLDHAFDAGGAVSAGLTASTIVSQWTWAATLLQSSGVGSRYGIAGPYWYASGATVQILLFAIISVNLKTKAPGAKTFPQIIRARFGRAAHIVFIAFALLTNIIVTAMLMVGGAAVMTTLVKNLSVEYAAMLVAIVAGAVTVIGNLGAALHVAYVTTSVMFIIILYFAFKIFAGSVFVLNVDDAGSENNSQVTGGDFNIAAILHTMLRENRSDIEVTACTFVDVQLLKYTTSPNSLRWKRKVRFNETESDRRDTIMNCSFVVLLKNNLLLEIRGNAAYIYYLISAYDAILSATPDSSSAILTTTATSVNAASTSTSYLSTTTTQDPQQQLQLGLLLGLPPDAGKNVPTAVVTIPKIAGNLSSHISFPLQPAESSTFLTMSSLGGLMFGIINVVGNFGTVFVDQSYWQLSVAARPRDGVFGFLLGGLVWFGVPFGFATSMSNGYLALCGERGSAVLTSEQVNEGLVPPAVASLLLGKFGAFAVLILVYMAVLSTAAAEVIAVASLIVFDVYGIYVAPFKAQRGGGTPSDGQEQSLDYNTCVMCGKPRGRLTTRADSCVCIPLEQCGKCRADDQRAEEAKRTAAKKAWTSREYMCPMHADYRKYQDKLSAVKTWAVCLCALALVPLTIVLNEVGISLAWLYLAMGILIGSAVIPISLAVTWARLTRHAVLWGSLAGCACAVGVWLVLAGTMYDGGLNDFFLNTGRDLPMLVGNLIALLLSGALTVAISMWETRDGLYRVGPREMKTDDEQELWRMTLDIDNPLFPWAEMYAKELGLKKTDAVDQRPSVASLARAFGRIKWLAYVGSITLTLGMLVFWPAVASTLGTFTQPQYIGWISVTVGWTLLAGLAIIIIPAVSEVRHALAAFRRRSPYGSRKVGVMASPLAIDMDNIEPQLNGHR